MPYQTTGSGCGCTAPSKIPLRKRYDPRSLDADRQCAPTPAPAPCPCYTKIDGCCNTIEITQGTTFSGAAICSGSKIGPVLCLTAPDLVSFGEPNCLKPDDEFTLWCGEGCSGGGLGETLYKVVSVDSTGLEYKVTPALPASIGPKKCYQRGLAIVGCPNPAEVTPPIAFLHRDLSKVQLIGALWSDSPETGTRRDLGVTISADPSIIQSEYEGVFFEGDRVCIDGYLLTPAVIVRVWPGYTECGPVWYAQLSRPATKSGVCAAAHIEHGAIAAMTFELIEGSGATAGCWIPVISAAKTAAIPLRESDRVTLDCGSEVYGGMKYQIFAVVPYLSAKGQLRDRVELISCGSASISASFKGMYSC